MPKITHGDQLNLHQLGNTLYDFGAVLYDSKSTDQEREEAEAAHVAVSNFLTDLGRDLMHAKPTKRMDRVFYNDWTDDLLDHLDAVANQAPEAISEDTFDETMRELISSLYPAVEQLPDFIAIDWNKTIRTMRGDYTEATLESEVYLVRLG